MQFIVAVAVGWLAFATVVVLLVGRVIRNRVIRNRDHPPGPAPRRTPQLWPLGRHYRKRKK